MKIGILGTGFGAFHAKIYNKLLGADSLMIYGRDEEKLKEIKHGINVNITNNYQDILTNNDIDLIDICLPSSLHREYAIEAMRNGKNVFCETPVALTLEDALAIHQAAKDYNKKVFVNLFIRHEWTYEYLYDLMKGNTLGKLKALHIRRKTPHLWGDLDLSNITTNLMIHEFDFVAWMLGRPNSITASGVAGKEGESHVITLLNYDDTIVEVHASSMMPDHHPFTVGYEAVFENGTLEYVENGYTDREEKSLILFTNQKQEVVEVPDCNCYEEAMKHVLECHQKNISTRLSIDDAVISLEIALKVKEMLLVK
ncbi:MAG: gfo/Idh/MocA family oxidoreductase [Anaerocolumna sp.]|nr:gfo/Idh/MocA family oxidoreductase [Anaerocolumna sp.]